MQRDFFTSLMFLILYLLRFLDLTPAEERQMLPHTVASLSLLLLLLR